MIDCPVDGRKNIEGNICPQCGTDLSPLLIVNELSKSLFSEALKFFEQKNYEDAIVNLTNALEIDSCCPDYFFLLGKSFFYTDNFQKAQININRALELSPGNNEYVKFKNIVLQSIISEKSKSNRNKRFNIAMKMSLFLLPIIAFGLTYYIMSFYSGKNISNELYNQKIILDSLINKSDKVKEISDTVFIKYNIRKGDSFIKISKLFYGNEFQWEIINKYNKDKLRNRDLLYPGDEIIIPLTKNK